MRKSASIACMGIVLMLVLLLTVTGCGGNKIVNFKPGNLQSDSAGTSIIGVYKWAEGNGTLEFKEDNIYVDTLYDPISQQEITYTGTFKVESGKGTYNCLVEDKTFTTVGRIELQSNLPQDKGKIPSEYYIAEDGNIVNPAGLWIKQ